MGSTARDKLLVTTFVLLAAVESIVVAEAHGGHGILGALLYAMMLGAAVSWLLLRAHGDNFRRVFSSRVFWISIVLLIGVLAEKHYLSTLGIQNRISTAKALEFPARALLLHGHDLYSVTAGETPISPGPGWIILWAPLSIFNLTAFIPVLALLFAYGVLFRRDRVRAGLFALLMLVQMLFLSEMRNGQDLFAISLMLVALALLLEDAPVSNHHLVLLGVLGGIIASARIPMIIMTSLIGLGLWRRDRRVGTIFLALSVGTAMVWHGLFYLWAIYDGDWYQPLHVLGRASRAGKKPRLLSMSALPVVLMGIYRRMGKTSMTWLLSTFLLMITLFAPVGIGEYLESRQLDWEGANYIVFPVPLLLTYILFHTLQRRDA
ncbi:hypothetical protein [Terriglobus roseus]|uniref:hypothetical protein n=1 Tax=Terriglobus roseus TaxID=392734 RepID=UPI0009427E1C|nr:hypothetical protein [Terriglobus roseus]